jgi:hypothetical protein
VFSVLIFAADPFFILGALPAVHSPPTPPTLPTPPAEAPAVSNWHRSSGRALPHPPPLLHPHVLPRLPLAD